MLTGLFRIRWFVYHFMPAALIKYMVWWLKSSVFLRLVLFYIYFCANLVLFYLFIFASSSSTQCHSCLGTQKFLLMLLRVTYMMQGYNAVYLHARQVPDQLYYISSPCFDFLWSHLCQHTQYLFTIIWQFIIVLQSFCIIIKTLEVILSYSEC